MYTILIIKNLSNSSRIDYVVYSEWSTKTISLIITYSSCGRGESDINNNSSLTIISKISLITSIYNELSVKMATSCSFTLSLYLVLNILY